MAIDQRLKILEAKRFQMDETDEELGKSIEEQRAYLQIVVERKSDFMNLIMSGQPAKLDKNDFMNVIQPAFMRPYSLRHLVMTKTEKTRK